MCACVRADKLKIKLKNIKINGIQVLHIENCVL